MVEFSFVSFQGKETKVGPLLGLDTYITGGKLQFEVNLIKNKDFTKCQYSNTLTIIKTLSQRELEEIKSGIGDCSNTT